MKKSAHKKCRDGKAWDLEWQLAECRWYGLIANSKRKKWIKDSLTRNYRRKQKREKFDTEVDDET